MGLASVFISFVRLHFVMVIVHEHTFIYDNHKLTITHTLASVFYSQSQKEAQETGRGN
jgi:hypothetical protein